MNNARKVVWCILCVLAFAAATGAGAEVIEEENIAEAREEAARAKREAAEAAKAKQEEQARRLAEAKALAKAEIEEAKQLKNQRLAEIDRTAPAEEVAERTKQIEAEYAQTIAKINMKARLETEKEIISQLMLPVDTSALLDVRELSFNGNTLVSTAELLEQMPVVFNASIKPLSEAPSKELYDFTPLFQVILNPGEVQKVSARTIQGLTQYVLSVYRQKNYAGIYVYVPAEALKGGVLMDGILPVEVIEAKVSRIGAKYYDVNQTAMEKGYLDVNALMAWSPVKEAQITSRKDLDDFVNLLNLNPDRYVAAVVSKGEEPKTLAVQYEIYEVSPWHWFLQVDNSGTDDRKWSPRVGLINTNFLGIDDTFIAMYQAKPESDIGDNYSLYGSYDFPLFGPRLRLNIYGGYSEFDVSAESSDIDFIGGGSFIGSRLRFNVLQTDGWFLDFVGSFSHERSKATPSLPFPLGYDVKMDLWGWGTELHKKDDMSNTEIGFSEVHSIGGLGSDDAEYAMARPGGAPVDNDFMIQTLWGSHSRLLDPSKVQRLTGTVRWIVADERLVPSKMTAFGGMYSIRGYEEYDVIADGGVLASAQYEFDLVKFDQSQKGGQPKEKTTQNNEWTLKKLAPLAFFDYGRAKIEDPASTEKGHQTLMSVGPGLLLDFGNFTGAFYYGFALKETDDTDQGDSQAHINLMMRW